PGGRRSVSHARRWLLRSQLSLARLQPGGAGGAALLVRPALERGVLHARPARFADLSESRGALLAGAADHVVAEWCFHHAAGATHGQSEGGLLERRDHLTAAEGTQVTPALAGGAVGMALRQVGEVGALI